MNRPSRYTPIVSYENVIDLEDRLMEAEARVLQLEKQNSQGAAAYNLKVEEAYQYSEEKDAALVRAIVAEARVEELETAIREALPLENFWLNYGLAGRVAGAKPLSGTGVK